MARHRSIWLILLSRLRKHAMLHLIAPLVVGVLVEGLVEVFVFREPNRFVPKFAIFWLYLFSFRTLTLFAGVFVSYIVIMYFLISKETALTDQTEVALNDLQDILNEAKSYFGISSLRLNEWFDPSMQVYLAMLINRKSVPDNFQHERTLLFFSDSEVSNFKVHFMDENHYGKCLALIHRDSEIPLSFLTRKDIFDILDTRRPRAKDDQEGFSDEDLEALGCYPKWASWRYSRFLRRLPLRWLRRRIKTLDCALVRTTEDEPVVLSVSKTGEDVSIKAKRGKDADPYLRLERLIKEKVYEGSVLRRDHNFVSSFALDRRTQVTPGSLLEFFHGKLYRLTGKPYRENFAKYVTIAHANTRGTYAITEKTSYKCRRGIKYIQDKIEWYMEKRSETDRIEEFTIRVTIPAAIFASPEFKRNFQESKMRVLYYRPEEQELTLSSGDQRLGYSFDLGKFREIDGLEIQTVVKYQGASNGHLEWQLSYPTKGFFLSVNYPPDREVNVSVFGVENTDVTPFDNESSPYKFRCESWLLPTTGGVLQFCQPISLALQQKATVHSEVADNGKWIAPSSGHKSTETNE